MSSIDKILVFLNLFRAVPAYLICKLSKASGKITGDTFFWAKCAGIRFTENEFLLFTYFVVRRKEFRSLVSIRLKQQLFLRAAFYLLFRPLESLHIGVDDLGERCYFQHGFSTIVLAKSVGTDCWINQQVTVGYKGDGRPTIGNRVRICVGAIVIGDITIGDDAVIAAGATVIHDVPPGEIWGGCPAKFIKKAALPAHSDTNAGT